MDFLRGIAVRVFTVVATMVITMIFYPILIVILALIGVGIVTALICLAVVLQTKAPERCYVFSVAYEWSVSINKSGCNNLIDQRSWIKDLSI